MARQLGYTEEEIGDLDRVASSERFEPRLREALLYAERVTRDPHTVGEREFEALRSLFTTSEIVEVTAVIGLTNYWNRFTAALRIDLSGSDAPYDAPGSRV